MLITLKLILLALSGLADRVRGGYPEGERPKWLKYLSMAFIGGTMSFLVSTSIWLILAGAILVFLLSWRTDNGWRGGYVIGKGVWWKPLLWGFMWAVPLSILGIWERNFLIFLLAGPLGAMLSILIAVKLPRMEEPLNLRHGHPWSELIEMPIIGIIVLGVLNFL